MIATYGSFRDMRSWFFALVLLAISGAASAFKIGVGFLGWPSIHESITADAITGAMPNANPLMISNIQSGVFNTDLSHQPISAFHFDNSSAGNANGGFDSGFINLYDLLDRAQSEATWVDGSGQLTFNPLFLNPVHASYQQMLVDIASTYDSFVANGSCLEELACPTSDFSAASASAWVDAIPTLLDTDPDPDDVSVGLVWDAGPGVNVTIPIPNFADMVANEKTTLDGLLGPHCRPGWAGGQCFQTLESLSSDPDFANLASTLRSLQYEYQAYYAWQHLGHAMHATQDFFAHSNYVELASGRRGPPCDPSLFEAAVICDQPISGGSGTFGAIPLPTDGLLIQNLASFRNAFNSATVAAMLNGTMTQDGPVPQAFADGNFNHLQTGYFPCIPGAGAVPHSLGFPYCHYVTNDVTSTGSAGMNKDEPYSAGTEPNLQNHPWAVVSARRLSTVLFTAFINNMPGTEGLISWCSVSATQPQGSVSARPASAATIMPVPPTPVSPATAPGRVLAPVLQRTSPIIQALPPLLHPPAVAGSPLAAIYVKVSPARALRVGEKRSIVVTAYDGRTGAVVPGLPVTIGAAQGVTGQPIVITAAPIQGQRCSLVGGVSVCRTVLLPLSGSVAVPNNSYPGGGGNFTLPIVYGRLLVKLVQGPVLQPGTSGFTVTTLDALTHQPVPQAIVMVNGAALGPANSPITYALTPQRVLQPKNSARATTVSVSHGPPIIVRAPGYSDELVPYVLSTAAP